MMEEIHKPENCKRLDVVLVNTGIFNNVNRETKSEDLSLQHIQKPLTKGLTQMVYLMNSLIKAEKNETETPSRQDILSSLSKSFSLLADSSHAIDLRRRKNFKSELKEEYKSLCADNNPVTELLFGNDLGKDAKELTDQKKTVLVKNVQKRKTWYNKSRFYPFLGSGHASYTQNRQGYQSQQYRARYSQRGKGARQTMNPKWGPKQNESPQTVMKVRPNNSLSHSDTDANDGFNDYDNVITDYTAGNISNAYDEWLKITQDQAILQLVKGCEIDFIQLPIQHNEPPSTFSLMQVQ